MKRSGPAGGQGPKATWRKPTPEENGLLAALLTPEFPGRDELRQQLKGCLVRVLDDEGSLEVQVYGAPPAAAVVDAIPVDATATDSDGVVLNAFIHVRDGLLAELEVIKVDGTPLRRLPPGDAWEVVALE